ncbi:MAG TPA: hypothetical protein VN023_08125 [Methylovorus sp.]|nr:hypothetical protein [Methylovorus sp.]
MGFEYGKSHSSARFSTQIAVKSLIANALDTIFHSQGVEMNLYVVLVYLVGSVNAHITEPMVIDGIETETACLSLAEKISSTGVMKAQCFLSSNKTASVERKESARKN